nr:MAG TPA: hypothetical protein [Caudoviricetes sp.]DAL19223.1 MAG TPA_asm: hypothetical protein [Caudoviricetes sp.]DAN83346.1 MAG TPA: hypothetical protein [Caudoviricetes sp.]DAS56183.1 MAG TPA: hypothetical protein [Bacteriophage sp.]DAT59179.1 MAG TPA: hypothetical protein [Caudoviricetes sp.]
MRRYAQPRAILWSRIGVFAFVVLCPAGVQR